MSESSGSTIVRGGSKITGNITGATAVVIEGELEGKVAVGGSVTVAPGGVVHGDIEAKNVSLAGTVKGNVVAVERVEILATGVIDGNVSGGRVSMVDGATMRGAVAIRREGGKG